MNKKRQFLFLFFLVIFIGAVTFGFLYLREEKRNEDVYVKLAQEQSEEAEEKSDVAQTTPEVTQDPEVTKPDIPINFKELQQENPDIYAWIRIPDTKIDYPVVQSVSDDTYYLNHTIEKKEGLPGSIYSESQNAQDFSDPNTVLYGHNMRNGSMFGSHKEYKSEDFYKTGNNDTFYIYTEDSVKTYKIFSVHNTASDSDIYTFNFSSDSYMLEFASRWQKESLYDTGVDISNTTQIVTLSSCEETDYNERLVIQGALVNETPVNGSTVTIQ